jgi:pimeloyl-ACP methyl ester carboxylesterase
VTPDLHDYADQVSRTASQISSKIILVGHSMGGLVITQAAEVVWDRLAALVYINGLLLRDRETPQSFLRVHADLDVDDLALKNMEISADGHSASFPAAAAPDVFYNRCTRKDADWATSQLRVQPTAVYATPLAITEQKFGSVPRSYIECSDDQAVSTKYQRQMLINTPCTQTYLLDADHSPFLSAIVGLCTALQDVAEQVNGAL